MPTLPTKSLFDKDMSLRSPFPRHIPVNPQPTVTPSGHEQSRTNNARMDFSQIKRPTPLKAKPAPSMLESPLPQSDVPHSLRNLLHYPKPQPLHNRLVSDKELDRLYNASPMPKIVDQAYSSLNVIPQRPRSHSLVLPSSNTPPVGPQIETSNGVDKKLEGTADLSDIPTFHDEPQDYHLPDSPPPRLGSPQEQDDLEILDQAPSEEESVRGSIQETRKEEPAANIVTPTETNDAPDTENIYPPNPRKRKSQFKNPRRTSKVKKTTELAPQKNLSKQHPDVEISASEIEEQMDDQDDRPSRVKAKSKTSSKRRQSTETRGLSTSRFSRIRSSVGQWFTGSFWDPPKSEKRTRRPPSQWWSPHDAVSGGSKSKKPSQKVVTTKENQSNEASTVIKESVQRVVSDEVEDFSDG